MRAKNLLLAVALLASIAAPAALARESVTIGAGVVAALQSQAQHVHLTGVSVGRAVARKDRLRSCQAGDRRRNVHLPGPTAAGETERKAATVACEQPPRGNLDLSGGLKNAQASALIAAG
jgi:hypothetical protein